MGSVTPPPSARAKKRANELADGLLELTAAANLNEREAFILGEFRKYLCAHVARALDAEREACAFVALTQRCELGVPWTLACEAIAKAIRALAEEEA